MTKEEKEIKEVKKDIEERLRFSNVKLWESLDKDHKERVVNKYLDLRDEVKLPMPDILEKDFLNRQQLALLALGLLLGIVSNLFTDAFLVNLKRLTGDGFLYVTLCFLIFFLIIKELFKSMQRNSGENLNRNKILEKLIELTKKENILTKTIIKKIDTIWFEEILAGRKKVELRLADFDIAEGDLLRLEEWVPDGDDRKPTGRVIEKKVTYVQNVNLGNWVKTQPELLEKGMYFIQFE